MTNPDNNYKHTDLTEKIIGLINFGDGISIKRKVLSKNNKADH